MTHSSEPPGVRHRDEASGHWVWIGVFAAALLGVAGLLLLGPSRKEDTAPPKSVVVVSARETPSPMKPVAPPAAASPRPVTARLPRIGSGAQPIPLPPEIGEALKLGATATMRAALPIERRTDVVCGEVSPDGSGRSFQRFVYVGVAKTGRIDDGSPELRKYFELVCVQQPG